MKNNRGFTLIELIMFIIITSLLASTILLALNVANLKAPTAHQQMVATQTARKCMEWLIGQRRQVGFASLVCGSTTIPAFCSVPTGFSISLSITCTTISSDTNFKTLTVNVTGAGYAGLTTLVAGYL